MFLGIDLGTSEVRRGARHRPVGPDAWRRAAGRHDAVLRPAILWNDGRSGTPNATS
jgi:sugar (pentulose or hexulose) kinase